MKPNILFLVALFASLWIGKLSAEPHQLVLDIEQLLQLVNENNSDIATARQNAVISQQEIKVAHSSKLPDINASLSLNYLGDATILNRNFSNRMAYETPHLGNSLELMLYQPLYVGGAINAGINLAKSQSNIATNQLEITRQNVCINAISCYLELFKANNLRDVYDENISVTGKVLEDMTARFNEGIVLKNDITRYELRLSTLTYDRLSLNNRISVLNHNLCLLLGLDDDTEIKTNILLNISNLPPIESKDYWTETALNNSLSMKAIDIESDINNHKAKLIKSDYLPHIGIIAGNCFDGPITFEIPPINKNLNIWYVGVNVSYNISSLFKTSKSLRKNTLQREEINLSREALSEHINCTINNVYTNYIQAFSMLETEEKNVELAEENYRIVENRYNNQLALLTDMLDASTAKLDAEVRLVNARANIIYYYYQLKYNSGTL